MKSDNYRREFLKRIEGVTTRGVGITGGRKGLEKESLRVTLDGHLSQKPHPEGLGSALTHPYITTDFSESQMELITPPFERLSDTLDSLTKTHQAVYKQLVDERLWCSSMPCFMEGESSIPLARYGTSNVGTMKTVYRRGLGHRYGRLMQTISGVHFNYSIPQSFWEPYRELLESKQATADFVSEKYFGLVRNFQRFGWVITYLFGASPAVCKSFLGRSSKGFLELHGNTYYGRFSTSLRMSDIGYTNQNQATLNVSTNSLNEYVDSLSDAIRTAFPAYERIGVKVNGTYRQLNTCILQIENEFYSVIRPKQSAYSGERPTTALQERGVEYIEVRALDVNPYDPLGVNEAQLKFVEALLLYCLLYPSPPLDQEEAEMVKFNLAMAACCGRAPDIELRTPEGPAGLNHWTKTLCQDVRLIAAALDAQGGRGYTHSVDEQLAIVEEPLRLPSARVIQELEETGESFFEFASRKSQEHETYFRDLPLDSSQNSHFDKLAKESLQQQLDIESADTISFDEYLERYFR